MAPALSAPRSALAVLGLLALAEAFGSNPTHYGSPSGGCLADEQSLQVEGFSGAFCSPSCTSSACPGDKPAGVAASPRCALQSEMGDKFCVLICSSDADCGAGACQYSSGVGICTYADAAHQQEQVVTVINVNSSFGTNPTHYGNPATGCEGDEQSIQVEGLSGMFCSASCTFSACPTDKPSGITANPQCKLQSAMGEKYCALVCSGDGECGGGSSCQHVSGIGLCTYAAAGAVAEQVTLQPDEPEVQPLVGSSNNPTHYGNPATGCQSDEQAIAVQGIPGDFCSPSCTRSSCPADKPAGFAANPNCALESGTGDKYCALMCSSSADCAAGSSCQHASGVGICTYGSAAGLGEPLPPQRPALVAVASQAALAV